MLVKSVGAALDWIGFSVSRQNRPVTCRQPLTSYGSETICHRFRDLTDTTYVSTLPEIRSGIDRHRDLGSREQRMIGA